MYIITILKTILGAFVWFYYISAEERRGNEGRERWGMTCIEVQGGSFMVGALAPRAPEKVNS